MNTELPDRIKSFLIGILLPAWITFLAAGYIAGQQTRTRHGLPLNRLQGLGWGLGLLGMALCIHAFGLRTYHNHPAAKHAVLAAGAGSFIAGLYLWFR